VQEKFPAQEGKGRDLLDLLAELRQRMCLVLKWEGLNSWRKRLQRAASKSG
jgi:hypothetical protein